MSVVVIVIDAFSTLRKSPLKNQQFVNNQFRNWNYKDLSIRIQFEYSDLVLIDEVNRLPVITNATVKSIT